MGCNGGYSKVSVMGRLCLACHACSRSCACRMQRAGTGKAVLSLLLLSAARRAAMHAELPFCCTHPQADGEEGERKAHELMGRACEPSIGCDGLHGVLGLL